MRLPFVVTSFAVSLVLVGACSDDLPSGSSSSSSGGSGGAPEGGAVVTEAGGAAEDAGETADAAPAKQTSLAATINDVVRTLDRAQFGVTKADDTLYLEAHEGGVAECPEKETPKRTVIVRDVPKGAPGTAFTKADGISVALLDFAGDQITAQKPSTTATAASVTIVDIVDDESVEIEVDATFPEGTVKGRIYATYCAAMNE